MVAVHSTMLPLGTPAPAFSLPECGGETVRLSDFAGKPVLIAFICNHCPFVKHIAGQLKALGEEFAGKAQVIAISSNDIEAYPADSPEKMVQEKQTLGYTFPYLYDAEQSVARAYTAACTPDFFVFDAEHKLAYRGQMDDSRPKRIRSGVYDFKSDPATGDDLRAALKALVSGGPLPGADDQRPSMGCNIKWKLGNEPDYFGG